MWPACLHPSSHVFFAVRFPTIWEPETGYENCEGVFFDGDSGILRKETERSFARVELTSDLPITSSDAPPVGATASMKEGYV